MNTLRILPSINSTTQKSSPIIGRDLLGGGLSLLQNLVYGTELLHRTTHPIVGEVELKFVIFGCLPNFIAGSEKYRTINTFPCATCEETANWAREKLFSICMVISIIQVADLF